MTLGMTTPSIRQHRLAKRSNIVVILLHCTWSGAEKQQFPTCSKITHSRQSIESGVRGHPPNAWDLRFSAQNIYVQVDMCS